MIITDSSLRWTKEDLERSIK